MVFASLLVAGSCYLALRQVIGEVALHEGHYHVPFRPSTAAGLVLLFFVIFAGIASRRFERFGRPWFYVLGTLTYPLYLLHQFIGYALINKLGGGPLRYLELVLVMAILLGLAWALHVLVEGAGPRALLEAMCSRASVTPGR